MEPLTINFPVFVSSGVSPVSVYRGVGVRQQYLLLYGLRTIDGAWQARIVLLPREARFDVA